MDTSFDGSRYQRIIIDSGFWIMFERTRMNLGNRPLRSMVGNRRPTLITWRNLLFKLFG